jgi:hypothetical protein
LRECCRAPTSEPRQLEQAEHHHPGEDYQPRDIGGSAADSPPSSAAPDAHEQHQLSGDMRGEHQHCKPSRRTGDNKHEGEQCGEQTDDAPADYAPEP